ncbi:MAG TPA: hypothetical protein DE042_00385 [Colwellia sp.]|nr:hypothetical protein [Colwellia sp.]
MFFRIVIFSTYEFFQESLANAKLAPSFFIAKKGAGSNTVILKVIILTHNVLSKRNNIYLLKELVFTSLQLINTLFKPTFLQLVLIPFFDTILGNKKSQLIKREANASTY